MKGKLQISLTTVCNLNCPSCCHGIPKETNPKHMPIEELKRISKFFPNIYALLVMGGEPTLHPRFKEIQILLSELFPRAYITLLTNGTYKEEIIGIHNVFISPILTRKKGPRDPMIPGTGPRDPLQCWETQYWHVEDGRVYPCLSVVALTRLYGIDPTLISTDLSEGWEDRIPDISKYCYICSAPTGG